MKIQVDKASLTHMLAIINGPLGQFTFRDNLSALTFKEQLDSIAKKCSAKLHQQRATLKFTYTEVIYMDLLVQNTPSPSALIVRQYFLNPLLSQIPQPNPSTL